MFDVKALIAEAHAFDTVPAEYSERLRGAHSLIERLADALEQSRPAHEVAAETLVSAAEYDWCDAGFDVNDRHEIRRRLMRMAHAAKHPAFPAPTEQRTIESKEIEQ